MGPPAVSYCPATRPGPHAGKFEPFGSTQSTPSAPGDTFNGALATAIAEGRPLFEAAVWASAAAALAVTQPGARTAIPDRAAIDRLAATYA